MASQSTKENKRIFQSELSLLKEQDYISAEMYEETLKAHIQYYNDLELQKQKKSLAAIQEKTIQKLPIQKTEKKKSTPEEIRERNISWSLNLGVILLLIGGLVVATSNWDTMTNWMKSGSIALVSILFYGISYLSKKLLKIERTSFAFIVLGSLFLPIFILSIGWFELLGSYFSFYGEGRFIFGAAGSFVLIPVYAMHAKQMSARLFVWFTFIALTAGVSYTLASFRLGQDGFYFGMMIFNACLAFGFHWFKKQENLRLFAKELVYFVQINLILTTVMMLIFFNSHVFYGINVLLAAAVYLAMVYVTGRKEFHFVFSIMVVYGAYQLIEYSILDSIGPILFVLVGASFLAVPKVMAAKNQWQQIFRITSAVVSSLSFIYISIEGILIRMNEPSFVLMLAYMLIAIQFTYLANVMNNKLFSYLSPVFLASALYEAVLLLDILVGFASLLLPLFMIGFVIFIVFGLVLKFPFVKIITQSSRDIGIAIMFFLILSSYVMFAWLEAGLMLLLFSFALGTASKVETRAFYTKTASWTVPLTFGLAFLAFGEEMRTGIAAYKSQLGLAVNAVLASVALLILAYVSKVKKRTVLMKNTFFTAQGFYTAALAAAVIFPINGTWMRPLIFIAGIGMYLAFYRYTRFRWVSYAAALVSLFTYFTFLFALYTQNINADVFNWIKLPLGAVIMLGMSYSLFKKDPLLAKGFAWVGHLFMPFALLLTLISYGEKSIWSYLLALAVYWLSSRMSKAEWKAVVFLYSAFLALFMTLITGMYHIFAWEYSDFAYLLTSCAVFIFWLAAGQKDKQRTEYFLLPFSLIGILAFIVSYPFAWLSFITMVLYVAGLIVFLHAVKKDFISGLPLLLLFIGTLFFLITENMDGIYKVMITGGIGLCLLLSGKLLYQTLFGKEGRMVKVDSYSFAAFLFILSMYAFTTDALWTQCLPGLLSSLLFFLQRKRINSSYAWVPLFISGLYLLQPYYVILGSISIPVLITRELYVLPFIAVVIFARYCLQDKFRKVTGIIQWAVLIIVSLILIFDGLASSTVYDALILGSLSLLSMLFGMYLRIKSYFFVGFGVLGLNVLLQTRPYWGNLPWWAYLLIAGSILIAVASYNEWKKQKTARGEKTIIAKWKEKLINKLKGWN